MRVGTRVELWIKASNYWGYSTLFSYKVMQIDQLADSR